MGFEHFGVGLAQQGLGRLDLIGNIDAVTVLFNHVQYAVDLAAGRFQHAHHGSLICFHWMPIT